MALPPVLRRSLLFVPADRPDRFPKALASGADAVCVDLEDAVGWEAKETAREAALGATLPAPRRGAEVILRINDPKTEVGRQDLDALCTADVPPDAVMLPKVADAEEIAWVAGLLEPWHPALRLIPIVETARGLAAVETIAVASPLVSALLFGAIDLSRELGCEVEWDALLYARSRVVHAAALAGIAAIDVPFMDVASTDALAAEARAVRRLGFSGKAAIHPTQVPIIQEIFTPSDAEIARATKVVEADEASEGAAVLSEGKVIDRAVAEAARRILALAEAIRRRADGQAGRGAGG